MKRAPAHERHVDDTAKRRVFNAWTAGRLYANHWLRIKVLSLDIQFHSQRLNSGFRRVGLSKNAYCFMRVLDDILCFYSCGETVEIPILDNCQIIVEIQYIL